MRLGARLAEIAAYVLPGSRVADIGTDHGYLAIHLVERGDVDYVVAGDMNEGPLGSARDLVGELKLGEKISVRLGDGLAVVRPEEVDTVVIAGMGGTTMVQILAKHEGLAHKLKRLILQPMVGAGTLRTWLIKNGYTLIDERLVKEEARIYEIIVAQPGSSGVKNAMLAEFGPLLWKNRDPLLKEYWQEIVTHLQNMQDSLLQSAQGTEHPKYRENIEKILFLKERIRCL